MTRGYSRPDKDGTHRHAFDRNKKRILATQDVCGICGKPVDKSLAYPHPMSACIDHIIPIAKGGHPSDIDNLQLAHLICNNEKSDKILQSNDQAPGTGGGGMVVNRNLPKSFSWEKYKNPTSKK